MPSSLCSAPREKLRREGSTPFHWKGRTTRSGSTPSRAEASSTPAQPTRREPLEGAAAEVVGRVALDELAGIRRVERIADHVHGRRSGAVARAAELRPLVAGRARFGVRCSAFPPWSASTRERSPASDVMDRAAGADPIASVAATAATPIARASIRVLRSDRDPLRAMAASPSLVGSPACTRNRQLLPPDRAGQERPP
jgi:hypothetical protein